jgi:hypothetical protein
VRLRRSREDMSVTQRMYTTQRSLGPTHLEEGQAPAKYRSALCQSGPRGAFSRRLRQAEPSWWRACWPAAAS